MESTGMRESILEVAMHKVVLVLSTCLFIGACASQNGQVKCDGRLEPINASLTGQTSSGQPSKATSNIAERRQ